MAIVILSDETVKKIAAGEVIERPVSVVKELVENSIDAGSSSILVELKDGGKRYIKVVDDGCGMDRDDAQLAVHRHATSKLREIDDLKTLTTLGFRGEALASICAVAKVEICTKPNTKAVLEGTKVVVEGGKIKTTQPIAHPGGTTVIVRDLFYNMPARRKYLKSTRTELAHIVDWIARQALVHTTVRFKLIHENVELLSTTASKDWRDSIAAIYGVEIAKALLPVNYVNGMKINGFITPPSITRNSADNISIYINKRYVKSIALNNAIKSAYSTLLPKPKYPIAVINVEISPSEIDVNVHPTKRIVKFENEQNAYESMMAAIQTSLRTAELTPKVTIEKTELPKFAKLVETIPVQPAPFPQARPVLEKIGKPVLQHRIGVEKIEPKKIVPVEKKLPPLRIIGQLKDLFVLAECDDGLVVLDQHAAHERILYEELKRKFETGIEAQELLMPVSIELTEKEKTLIEDHKALLTRYGFTIEHFGGRTYRIKTVPVAGAYIQDFNIIHDIIDNILTIGKKGAETDLKDGIAKLLACKTAIKSGDKRSQQELERLVGELYKTENPFTCPHGRPTIITITAKELQRKFSRSE